ncbi:MAG: c-type cytochrome domain-containing protein [Chitinophagales bacterium]
MKRAYVALATGFLLVFAMGVFTESCKHLPLDFPDEDVFITPVDTSGGTDTLFLSTCDPDTVYFQNDILPLLLSNCAIEGCHDATTHEEGIILSTYADVMNPGDHLINTTTPANSKLYKQLFETGEDRMPPPPNAPLTSAEKALILTWITQGALNNHCDDCDTSTVTYALNIQPILNAFCVGCHDHATPASDIDLTVYNAAGGFAGVQDVAADGRLYGSVNHDAGYVNMPSGGSSLPQCLIDQIRIWVENGYQND